MRLLRWPLLLVLVGWLMVAAAPLQASPTPPKCAQQNPDIQVCVQTWGYYESDPTAQLRPPYQAGETVIFHATVCTASTSFNLHMTLVAPDGTRTGMLGGKGFANATGGCGGADRAWVVPEGQSPGTYKLITRATLTVGGPASVRRISFDIA